MPQQTLLIFRKKNCYEVSDEADAHDMPKCASTSFGYHQWEHSRFLSHCFFPFIAWWHCYSCPVICYNMLAYSAGGRLADPLGLVVVAQMLPI